MPPKVNMAYGLQSSRHGEREGKTTDGHQGKFSRYPATNAGDPN